ncbi:endothelin-converting enzyme 2-like [Haemaphysalis longicornis]
MSSLETPLPRRGPARARNVVVDVDNEASQTNDSSETLHTNGHESTRAYLCLCYGVYFICGVLLLAFIFITTIFVMRIADKTLDVIFLDKAANEKAPTVFWTNSPFDYRWQNPPRKTHTKKKLRDTTTGRKSTASNDRPADACHTGDCTTLERLIRERTDFGKNPCDDFYEYACGNYKGTAVLPQMTAEIRATVLSLLRSTTLPGGSQTAMEKATGMWKACLEAPKDAGGQEMLAVRQFAHSLDLDFLDIETMDPKRSVGEHVLQLCLEYGLSAFISIQGREIVIDKGKSLLEVSVAKDDKMWLQERKRMKSAHIDSYYTATLHHYTAGTPTEKTKSLISQLNDLEDEVADFLDEMPENVTTAAMKIKISDIPGVNDSVRQGAWSRAVAWYTHGHYKGDDKAYVWLEAQALLSFLDDASRQVPFRRLLAWSIVRQLAGFGRHRPSFKELLPSINEQLCIEKVSQVMEASLMGVYLMKVVTADAQAIVEEMFSKLKTAFERQVQHSSWLDEHSAKETLVKLRAMVLLSGFPHRIHSEEDMNKHYAEFPESRRGKPFWETWLRAASLAQRQLFQRNVSDLSFETADAIAYYGPLVNTVFLPAGIIREPLFLEGGPSAYNYGALGTIMAHEMTHAYDLNGIIVDVKGAEKQWITNQALLKFGGRIACLQLQHGKASGWDIMNLEPSEYLADFVGSLLSYDAFSALPAAKRNTIFSLKPYANLTSDQLFFVARCALWCATTGVQERDHGYAGYAAKRARCNVPAMNTPGFGTAFNCPIGSKMNPKKKCRF